MPPEFNFFGHWYPLSPVEDLDPKRPTPVTLLGMRLVIWKPGSSDTYQVFVDQCPHRLAPLSEGRVDEKTGHLMCSYHGWQFDAQGNCKHIPQAENPALVQEKGKHWCAVALPTRQENDLLWVWPEPDSVELAESTPLPLSPVIDAKKGFVWSSMVRDLDYDWQTLIENVADPSHVPFAHHGIQGDRKQGRPIPIKIVESSLNLIKATIERNKGTTITFEPPCRLEYNISVGEKGQFGLVTYCLPVMPGKARIVAQFPRNFAKIVHFLTPRWWNHIIERNSVLDGDMVLLHQQEYFLRQKEKCESWKTAYKLPTSADRLVIEFRNWFDKYCNGQLPWTEVGIKPEEPRISDRLDEILDRYRQHTQHCRSCRDALKVLQRLQIVLLAFFAVTVAGVSVLPDEWRFPLGLPLIILALLGLGAYSWLKFWLEPRFYFVDYIHAQK